MNTKLILLAMVISPMLLSGCNTAKGFGMDLEDLGRVIQGKQAENYQTKKAAARSAGVTSNTSATTLYPSTSTSTGTVQYSTGTTGTGTSAPVSSSGTQVYSYPYTEGSTTGTSTIQSGSSSTVTY